MAGSERSNWEWEGDEQFYQDGTGEEAFGPAEAGEVWSDGRYMDNTGFTSAGINFAYDSEQDGKLSEQLRRQAWGEEHMSQRDRESIYALRKLYDTAVMDPNQYAQLTLLVEQGVLPDREREAVKTSVLMEVISEFIIGPKNKGDIPRLDVSAMSAAQHELLYELLGSSMLLPDERMFIEEAVVGHSKRELEGHQAQGVIRGALQQRALVDGMYPENISPGQLLYFPSHIRGEEGGGGNAV